MCVQLVIAIELVAAAAEGEGVVAVVDVIRLIKSHLLLIKLQERVVLLAQSV